MQVISFSRIREFGLIDPEAHEPLRRWFHVAKKAEWPDFAAIRADFAQADLVGR